MFVGVCDDVCLFVGGCQLRLTYLFRRPVTLDRAQIWHACADRYSHLNKKLHTRPQGGLGCYLLIKNLSRRTAPKFGTHVRIDILIFKKKKLTHPTPVGFRGGLSIVKTSFAMDRAQIWLACADRYSHLKKIDPPHHRRVQGPIYY